MSELREKRLSLGIELKEIANITRISQSYLKAIEDEEFHKLPVEVYTKAYIKQYAKFLGINDEGILLRYNDFLTQQKTKTLQSHDRQPSSASYEPQAIQPPVDKTKKTINYKSLLNVSILVLVIVILISVVLWHKSRQTEIKEVVKYTPPPPTEIQQESQQSIDKTPPRGNPQSTGNEPERLSQEVSSGALNTQVTTQKTRHNLILTATEKVWVQVLIDNKEKKEILLNPGDTVSYDAGMSFSLLIGNAGGIKINFNGKIIDKLGNSGDVVRLKLPNEDRQT